MKWRVARSCRSTTIRYRSRLHSPHVLNIFPIPLCSPQPMQTSCSFHVLNFRAVFSRNVRGLGYSRHSRWICSRSSRSGPFAESRWNHQEAPLHVDQPGILILLNLSLAEPGTEGGNATSFCSGVCETSRIPALLSNITL